MLTFTNVPVSYTGGCCQK